MVRLTDGDQNSNVFVTGLCRCGINVEQAGQLNAKAVPVADLITDLDIHDGGAAILLAAPSRLAAPRAATDAPVHLRKVRREMELDIKINPPF